MPIITYERCEACSERAVSAARGGPLTSPRTLEGSSFEVVLHQPEIPQNTGNIARTCAATQTPLHLIEPLGFRLSDRYLKRAGLDYWPSVVLRVHRDLESFLRQWAPRRCIFFSARAETSIFSFRFEAGDCLVFGSETAGLPHSVLDGAHDRVVKIPIDRTRVRSLNLATTVGVALFEAMRQVMARRCGVSAACTGDG
ncbi:MAG: tRNA (cytidine(34)-2'-O)-methyltransferase [Syntrophobacteraceae bacterium]|nr:tRNA (cytidine(34)-2'-O)-methyltransferase [Syntrophobacteraceae bacterium]